MSDTNKPTETSIVKIHGWEVSLSSDEPRVRDADLAAWAGMVEPRKVRRAVLRNRAEIEAHGELMMRTNLARIEKAGAAVGFELREVSEYWLSEPQALALVAHLRTPKAMELRIALVKLFVAVRRGLVTAPPSAIPIAEVHGSRVGETTVRAELVAWCRLAARSLGVTIHRVHGAIRRQYKVASAYHLSLNVWPMVRAFLESLATQRLFLDAPTRPALRLIAGGAQTSMPWAVEVANR